MMRPKAVGFSEPHPWRARVGWVFLGLALLLSLSGCGLQGAQPLVAPRGTAASSGSGATPVPAGPVARLGFKIAGWT